MGRPELPIDPSAGPAAQFALALRARRLVAGFTYRRMAPLAHYSSSALSQAASGAKLPSWKITEAYLRAIAVCEPELTEWKQRWTVAAHAEVARGNGHRPPG